MLDTREVMADMARDFLLRRETDSKVLNEPDVTNSIWQAEVTGSYWSARNIGFAVLSQAGTEIVSPAGKFWKRAKDILKQCILEHSTLEPQGWTDADWNASFDRLRNRFQVLSGSAVLPAHRTYYGIPAVQSMMLGQWFSFHQNSCWWTSYDASYHSFMAGSGWMIRGMWTSKPPTLDDYVIKTIDGVRTRLPRLTDFNNNYTDKAYGVRCMVQPLNNGLFACFNGYKADLWPSFDFTAKTRLHCKQTAGDVMPTITNDLVHFIQEHTNVEVGVKQFRAEHEHAFINNDRYYLIGEVDNPYISYADNRGLSNLSFRRFVDTPEGWNSREDLQVGDTYLDQGWHHNGRSPEGERFIDPDHEDNDNDDGDDDD